MIDKSFIGKTMAEFDFPVTRTKIKEFAVALKSPDPLYIDQCHAREQGYRDVLMPVTFPVTFPFHIGMPDAVMDSMKLLGMNENTSVHGEVSFNYMRTVHAGETLKAVMKVSDIYEKERRDGSVMTFVDISFNYYDEDDTLVCSLVNVFIEKS